MASNSKQVIKPKPNKYVYSTVTGVWNELGRNMAACDIAYNDIAVMREAGVLAANAPASNRHVARFANVDDFKPGDRIMFDISPADAEGKRTAIVSKSMAVAGTAKPPSVMAQKSQSRKLGG